MDENFRYTLRVRYAECDAQQVVFNGRYADYADAAVTEFVRLLWGDYKALLAQGIDNQVVKLTIEWQAPARFDEVIAITIKTVRIGSSSFTLQLDYFNHHTEQPLARAEIIYVMVDTQNYRKMAIPDSIKAALEQGAAGKQVDHAGL